MDILVSNEAGIQSLIMSSMEDEDRFNLTQYVPDPTLQAVPCAMNIDWPNFRVSFEMICSDFVAS